MLKFFCSIAVAASLLLPGASFADRIVLRSFESVDEAVTSFDEDGVKLKSGRLIPWDNVEQGKVSGKQQEFDKLLSEIAEPMFRIRRGLMVGDYRGILEHTSSVYDRYAERHSRSAYFVCQAHMWALLAHGRREEALGPYLRCLELLRWNKKISETLPGERRLDVDTDNGFTNELSPTWFDSKKAKAQLSKASAAVKGMESGKPVGVYYYYGTLALAAGNRKVADRVFKAAPSDSARFAPFRQIIAAQLAINSGDPAAALQQLKAIPPGKSDLVDSMALYWRGLAELKAAQDEEEQRQAALTFLRLAAKYQKTRPDFAAAGLAEASQILKSLKEEKQAGILRKELVDKYPNTYHALQISGKEQDDSPQKE